MVGMSRMTLAARAAIVTLVGLAPLAAGQGARGHYLLAATLDQRLDSVVLGAGLGYRWSEDGSRLWFERLGSGGEPEAFEFVVASREVVPSTPLGEMESDSPWALPLMALGRRARSRGRGRSANLRIVNRTDEAIDVQWLDTSGEAKDYGTIAAGQERMQSTSEGHLWRILLAEQGGVLGLVEAPPGGGVVFVDGPAKRDASRASAWSKKPMRSWQVEVRDQIAWLKDEKGEHALVADGAQGLTAFGRPAEAPGGQHVAVMFRTGGDHREITLIEAAPGNQLQPVEHTLRYDKPGDKLDERFPGVFDTATGQEVKIDRELIPDPWSLRDLHWSDDGSRLYFVHVQRGHSVVKLMELDVRTGGTRALIDERPGTFFDYAQKMYVKHLEATDEVLWMSERSGWNHLWRVSRTTGEMTPVTASLGESVVVRAVEAVDEAARTVRVRLRGLYPDQDPYHDHFARVHLDTGEMTPLTSADGTHKVEFSPDGLLYVATWERIDHAPVRELRRASDGELLIELSRADASEASRVLARTPARFVAPGRDGKTPIHGILYWPSHFDSSKRYPVIEKIYAGPHDAHVPKTFSLTREPQRLAELGFIVVQIDGMGTNWRSKAFHDVAWKNLADAGFPDRIAWMRAAAESYPEMDLTRVGIYGGSAGGQNAMRAVLDHADFYRAAAADCGCHDNRMDKVWWNELWMGWPVDESYLASSNVEDAAKLDGALLLTVGAMDRNVDPSSTMQVVDALIRANKDFELIVFPSGGHGAGGSRYGRRRRDDFFVRELYGHEPRWAGEPRTTPARQKNANR
ncbi:MAG: dipeptidyl aminopeptidase/acylaminoacyl peptidase [Planctomycetota bacterium]|jgi:dipeptidyl aminopeptidase/acylaminoacyl peptidase